MSKQELQDKVLEAKADAVAFHVASLGTRNVIDAERFAERAEAAAQRAWELAGDDEELRWFASQAQGHAKVASNACRELQEKA